MPCHEIILHRKALRRGKRFSDKLLCHLGMTRSEIAKEEGISYNRVSLLVKKWEAAVKRKDPTAMFILREDDEI